MHLESHRCQVGNYVLVSKVTKVFGVIYFMTPKEKGLKKKRKLRKEIQSRAL